MALGNINRFRSWFVSAGIITVVTIWVLSGQFGGSEENEQATAETVAAKTLRNAVRVRTQSAEEVMRTIVVNGKTAPARITHLAAETDGRIEYVGAERGASLDTGNLIVRLNDHVRPVAQ